SITKNGWWQLSPSLKSLSLSQWSELDYNHIFYFNEPAGKWAKTTSLTEGLGQIVYLKGSSFTSGAKLLEETGRPNTGDQTYLLTSDGSHDNTETNIGWNFISNPYAAPIDWESVSGWAKNNVIGSFYVWDAASGDYIEFVDNIGNPVIAPGQGFWVKVNDINASASIVITEDAKSETRSSIYRQKAVDPLLSIEIKDPAANTDKMYVRLKEGATNEFDSEFDAYKMAGDFVVISSFTDAGTELSINSLPIDLMQKTIPLNITSKQKGTHQLNISRSALDHQKILLKDKFLNQVVDLDQEASYQFDITNDAASYGVNRFELVITQEVQFKINTQTIYSNTSASIPVTVSNFKNILATQFSLSWDESLMSYSKVHSFALPSMTEANFNQAAASSLAFVWDQQDLIPQSLADGDTLFVLQFDVVGLSDVTTSLSLPGSVVDAEVIGTDLVTLASAYRSGEIMISKTKTLAGKVQDINQKPVVASIVTDGTTKLATTDATGHYSIELASDQEVDLSISSNEPGNKSGISTLDILMARRHLLAQEVLTNPFIKSAADVDGSGNVSVMDIALIRQIILGHEENAIKNKSWRYLSASAAMENVLANDPDQYYDFVAIKIGDLNSSWNTDNSKLMTTDLLKVSPAQATSGQQVEVPVSINQKRIVTGFQMTLNYDADKLELQNIISPDLKVNFFIKKPGEAVVQWDDQEATGLLYDVEEVLFNLVFAVTGSAGESAAISINSELTDAILLDEKLNEYLLANSLAEVSITEELFTNVNFGNYPNPVVDYTNLVFNATEAGPVKISIYDAAGHRLETISENAEVGYNSLEWSNKNYKTGTYILKMQQGDKSYTTRMLIK
ncbi:MAG: cohesin domain-containing protein, partial [Cyclobacteriaceae bacterium]